MFGKVKCTGCGKRFKKKETVTLILQGSDGSKSVYLCHPCAALLDSEMKFI